MRISSNFANPYLYRTNNPNNNQKSSNNRLNFTSGYGAEEFNVIDNPDLTPRGNGERWRNIAKAIKMMTVDAYRESHGIYPNKPQLLFTPEESKELRNSFYEGTDVEDLDPESLVPKRTRDVDFSDFDDVD